MTVEGGKRSGERDPFLDCLKGIAILIVVAGHTFQGVTPDFDNYWPFRVIYSFHMPMFMFVSGMVASLFLTKIVSRASESYTQSLQRIAKDLIIRASRLLVPFFVWAIVMFFYRGGSEYTLPQWLWKVLNFPDNGLWFLFILFQECVILAVLIAAIVLTFKMINELPIDRGFLIILRMATLIAIGFLGQRLLDKMPDNYGFYLTKIYFLYFYLGLLFHYAMPLGLKGVLRAIPYVLFIALAPYWHRLHPSAIVDHVSPFMNPSRADADYRFVVAISGSLVTVDIARLLSQYAKGIILTCFAFLGIRSLDIYAIHFFYLGYHPAIIAPVVMSLLLASLLRLNSYSSMIFFGQRSSSWASLRRTLAMLRPQRQTPRQDEQSA